MQKELERAGIATAMITSLPLVATAVGATRIVQGFGIIHPLGRVGLDLDRERGLRRAIVETALEALGTPVTGPQIFRVPAGRVAQFA